MARIVFDLDGTLIDSAPDIGGIANRLMEDRGLEPITLEQTRDFVGNGASVFIEKLRDVRGLPDKMHATLLEEFMAHYEGAVDLTLPYPGVFEALQSLRAKGHRLGICTNKPIKPTMAVLRHLDLEPFFDTFIGGDSLTVRKPNPAPLFAAFEALGTGARLFVGDSDVDAATGVAAGVTFLLFTEGYRKQPVEDLPHDRAFSSFDAFDALVDNMIEGD